MESRKIQVSAGGSFFIVLPKEWSKDLGLKKGGRVNVMMEEDGSIRLLPSDIVKERERKTALHVEDYDSPKQLDLQLKANYMSGYSVIDIVSKKRIDPELKKTVKASAAELIGVETEEEKSDKLSLRAIVDPAGFPLNNLNKRLCDLALSMHSDVMKAFRERDMELAEDVKARGNDAMKLYRLMIRQLMLAHADRNVTRSLGIERSSQCLTLSIVARDVSRAIYYIIYVAKNIADMLKAQITYPDVLVKSTLKTLEVVYEMIKKAFQAFLEGDIVLAAKVMEQMGEVRKFGDVALRDVFQNVKDVYAGTLIGGMIRAIRRIAGYAVAMADDTILHSTVT